MARQNPENRSISSGSTFREKYLRVQAIFKLVQMALSWRTLVASVSALTSNADTGAPTSSVTGRSNRSFAGCVSAVGSRRVNGPPQRPDSASGTTGARRPSSWPCSSTAATASCRSARTSSARTCRRPRMRSSACSSARSTRPRRSSSANSATRKKNESASFFS